MRLALREVRLAFRRAPLLGVLSVLTIAFSLYAFGLYGLVAINIREALRGIEERVEIRAFIRDDSREAAVDTLVREASMMREVATAVYVTPESAYVRAKSELPEFAELLEGTVLPGSVEVRLKEGMRDPLTVRAVKACEFDDDAILLWPWTARRTLERADFTGVTLDFIVFFPRPLAFLRRFEPRLRRLAIGAQQMLVGTRR